MTVCNMTIEGGARAGLIQPDEKTFQYLKDRPMSPKKEKWNQAVDYWSTLKSDQNSNFDKVVSAWATRSHHAVIAKAAVVAISCIL